jgi:NAD(P)-dependent dehydrogenase (short-subunit alcohol dehydrogenase family)
MSALPLDRRVALVTGASRGIGREVALLARCVAWLAGPANTYLTGQVITIDGGVTAT